ncbi:MAG: integrase/recombinase XerD [Clostridiales bacterium]|jgi:integrase/recombinase XerD|nr:integrase/recombinase XerD [Clostridiales bacterium]MDK2992153.1 integrase/recombinase XerD [Clostridiales bacterium]
MWYSNYIDGYKRYLVEERKMTSNTVECYLTDVRQYLGFTDGQAALQNMLSSDTIAEYMDYLKHKGCISTTISRKISSIKSFCKFMVQKGYSDIDPSVDLQTPKMDKRVPAILSPDKVKLLLAQPNLQEPKGIRDKAMLEILYATGFKVSELLELTMDDINTEMNYVKCRSGDKERLLPINRVACQYLQNYIIQARDKLLNGKEESVVFVNCHGQPMSRQGFWKIVKYYAKKAGINQPITPYTLRHSFAINMLSSGMDIKTVQQLLGHTDISTTYTYMQFVHPKGVAR